MLSEFGKAWGRYLCSKCKCECDGEKISDKLNRKPGQRKRKNGRERPARKAAKIFKEQTRLVLKDALTDYFQGTEGVVTSLVDLWKAFDMPPKNMKSLPS